MREGRELILYRIRISIPLLRARISCCIEGRSCCLGIYLCLDETNRNKYQKEQSSVRQMKGEEGEKAKCIPFMKEYNILIDRYLSDTYVNISANNFKRFLESASLAIAFNRSFIPALLLLLSEDPSQSIKLKDRSK